MDRSKWEYKKLGDICSKLTDGSHNPPKGIDDSEYRMISSQNIFNDRIELSDYRCLSKEDFEVENKRTTLKKGDLLLTIVGAIGRCYVLNGSEGNLTLQRSVAALTPKDNINSRYLMYYFMGNNAKLIEEAHGVAQKGIYLKQLRNFIVPVPPLADQQRIVAELDCLNEMIAVKQEQLKEFDKLAQSIFYDMFGDPVANDKQWDMVSLENIATLINGRAYKQDELLSEGKYKVIRVGNFFSNNDYYYSNLELEDNKYCDSGDLLYTWSASFGARIWDGGKVIYHYHIWKIDYQADKVDKLYLCYLLNLLTERFKEDVHGVTMVHLTKAGMEKNPVILPSLSLQQQFAEKISAIEAQKELVKQSIAETQSLLDYTMDFYFN